MNLGQAMAAARQELVDAGIEEASLESEVLLRHVLGIDRARLFTGFGEPLGASEERHYFKLVARRIEGEPTAYITGHREFFGLDILVNPAVLIPRPETELLVEKALEIAGSGHVVIADIGTGSGAVAVCLAMNLPDATVYATDVSKEALAVARQNCEIHGVASRVKLLQGNLLEPLPEIPDIIAANLPYVKQADIPAGGPLSYEPAAALDGGPEGLNYIMEICRQAAGRVKDGGAMLLEIGQGQAGAVEDILHKAFPGKIIEFFVDLAGIQRVACLRLTQGDIKC